LAGKALGRSRRLDRLAACKVGGESLCCRLRRQDHLRDRAGFVRRIESRIGLIALLNVGIAGRAEILDRGFIDQDVADRAAFRALIARDVGLVEIGDLLVGGRRLGAKPARAASGCRRCAFLSSSA
jgi:hypothetical protein